MALQSRKGNASADKASGTYEEAPQNSSSAANLRVDANDPSPALERLVIGHRQRSPLETDLAPEEDDDDASNTVSMSQQDRQQSIQHWKDSLYAVGVVPPTWDDEIRHRQNRAEAACTATRRGVRTANVCVHACNSEDVGDDENLCCCLILSGWVCRRESCLCFKCKARRIGNMIILKERPFDASRKLDPNNSDEDSYEDEEAAAHATESGSEEEKDDGSSTTRRRRRYKPPNPPTELICVVGPYWPVLMCLTYPLVLGVSGATLVYAIPYQHVVVKIVWTLMTICLLYMLFNVSCRDPGLLLRHKKDSSQSLSDYGSRRTGGTWRWSEKAKTYHPRNAIFDPDCAVVVEGYDHVCPWTGTAIGKKNMGAFQGFVGSVFFCLMMDVLLLTGAIGGPYGFMGTTTATVTAGAAAKAAAKGGA
jgi:hypothetical protein